MSAPKKPKLTLVKGGASSRKPASTVSAKPPANLHGLMQQAMQDVNSTLPKAKQLTWPEELGETTPDRESAE